MKTHPSPGSRRIQGGLHIMKKLLTILITLSIILSEIAVAAVASYTPWSFVIAPDFFSGGAITYSDTKNFKAAYDHSSDNGTKGFWLNIADRYSKDRNWNAYLESIPEEGLLHFTPGAYKYTKTGSAPCFTIPSDGWYDIDCSVTNRGLAQDDGSWYYSDSGMARITIVKPGETKESKENCFDFYAKNEGESGIEERSGRYKSGAIYLTSNTKIYLRIFSGREYAGTDYYVRYVIDRLDLKEDTLERYDLSQAGIENAKLITTDEVDYIGNNSVTSHEDGNDISAGAWNIYKSPSFYKSVANVRECANENDYTYRSFSDFKKLQRRFSDKIVYWSNIKVDNLDRNWTSQLIIDPSASDGMVNVLASGWQYNTGDNGITAVFTAPKNGTYEVNFEAENRGLNGAFGSGNMARLSFFRNGETKETRENTRDFEIRNTNGSRGDGRYNSGSVQLSAGDKVAFSLFGGFDWYGDNFFASCTVSELDTWGNKVKTYDLSRIEETTLGNWRFYSTNPENTDSAAFSRIAPKAENSGFSVSESISGGSDGVSVTLKGGEDAVIGYSPYDEGIYYLSASLASTQSGAKVSLYENNKELSSVNLGTSGKIGAAANLGENEKAYLRLSLGSAPEGTVVTVNISAVKREVKEEEPTRTFLNVMNFGAKGDGKTDDRAAIQAAFDSAAKIGGGVYIPEGEYLYSEKLLANGIVVRGDGAEKTALISTNEKSACLELTGEKCGVFGIYFMGAEGVRSDDAQTGAIYVNRAEDFVVADCRISLFSGAGILVYHSSYGRIFNNYAENTRADGIHVVSRSNNIDVMYNTIYSSGDDCISFTSYAKDKFLTQSCRGYGNTVYALPGSRGIVACSGKNNEIFSNYIDSGVQGIAVEANSSWGGTGTSDISVHHNSVKNTFVNNYGRSGSAVVLFNDSGAVFNENKVYRNDLYNPCFRGVCSAGNSDMSFKMNDNLCFFDFSDGKVYENISTANVSANLSGNSSLDISKYKGDKNPGTVSEFLKTEYTADKSDGLGFVKNQIEEKTWEPWSFFVTSGYVSGASSLNKSGMEYGDISNETYMKPVKAKYYYEAGTSSRTRNAFVSSSERFGTHATSARIYLGRRVSFAVRTPNKVRDNMGEIAVMFTAPENGVYSVSAPLYSGNSKDYDNIGRCTVLKNGATVETAENSEDFEITPESAAYEKNNISLSKGDRILIRLSTGDVDSSGGILGNIVIQSENERYSLTDMSANGENDFGTRLKKSKDGKISAEVLNSSDNIINGQFFLGVYENGAFKKIEDFGNIRLNRGIKAEKEISEEVSSQSDIKLFFWNSLDGMKPVTK